MQSTNLNRYVPHVAVATFAVLGAPALAASALEALVGVPPLAGIGAAVVLSLGLAAVGSAIWQRHPGSRDLVFGDLMAWGWLRRMRSERRLAESKRVLGGKLSAGDRAKVLEQLAGSLEARDLYTHGHSNRVTRHAERIAMRMGLPADEVARVRTAAAVHDVGKIHTPREVLNKPGRLTDVEFEVIKRHAPDGADMVAELGDREVTAMVRHHHERLDGSGYPDGLTAEQIPVGARIIAVADTFDAMTSARPYRSACSHKRAMDTLLGEAGTKLDADAVAAFRSYYSARSPVALWSLIVNLPVRVAAWAGGALQGGAATLGAAALIGGGTLLGPGGAANAYPEASLAKPVAARAATDHPTVARADRPHGKTASTSAGPRGRRLAIKRRSGARGDGGFHRQPRGKQLPRQPGSPPAPSQVKPPATPQPGTPSAPTPQVPSVQTPPVQTPSIDTGPIRTPSIQTPPIHTPGVNLPPVQVPSVNVPQVNVPSLSLPPVHVPEVRVPPLRLP